MTIWDILVLCLGYMKQEFEVLDTRFRWYIWHCLEMTGGTGLEEQINGSQECTEFELLLVEMKERSYSKYPVRLVFYSFILFV